MKYTLFISDLHLSEKRPDVLANFEGFVDKYVRDAEALYILGDFFAQWLGDDDHSEFNAKVKVILNNIATYSVPVYLMPGNHDFMLGNEFALASKCTLLLDPYRIDLYGKPTLLMHGDLLCTKDWSMILFHDFLHNKWCKFLFSILPVFIRKRIADYVEDYILQSKKQGRKSQAVMQVQQGTIERLMLKHGVEQLIHGHIHREEVSEFVLGEDNYLAKRLALGAWLDGEGSALFYLADGSYQFKTISCLS